MKNIFFKIIMGIMLVTILNANFAVADVIGPHSPQTLFKRIEELQELEQKQETTKNQLQMFISGAFISGTISLIIIAGLIALIYIKTQKNKQNSSNNTESSNQPK